MNPLQWFAAGFRAIRPLSIWPQSDYQQFVPEQGIEASWCAVGGYIEKAMREFEDTHLPELIAGVTRILDEGLELRGDERAQWEADLRKRCHKSVEELEEWRTGMQRRAAGKKVPY